jgi:transposase
LTVLGRRLLVDRILVDGMAVAHAADMVGVSRQTAWKWLRRYEAEGEAGLEDRSSRPAHSPRALPQAQVDAILAARHEHRFGPHRLAPIVGVPRSTIGDVLTRHGLSRLADQDGPTGIPSAMSVSGPVSSCTSTSRSSAESLMAAATGSADGPGRHGPMAAATTICTWRSTT